MVDLLVAAGADVNACVAAGAAHEGDPAITYLLFKVNKDNTDSAKQILQILIGERHSRTHVSMTVMCLTSSRALTAVSL
jgi:hypothetical protein